MTKPSQGMSIDLQHFADNGSADNGTQATGNAEEQLSAAFGGAAGTEGKKPADKPSTGETAAGGKQSEGDLKLAAWTEQLPPEMRFNADTAAKIAKFTKVGDMAKAFLELEAKAATGGIPGKNATSEEVAEFWEKAGRPAKAEGYSFTNDKDNNGAGFAQAAHKANLTTAQADAMFKTLTAMGAERYNAIQQAQLHAEKEAAAALTAEYGSKYEQKMELLKRGLAAAGPNVGNLIRQSGLSGNPEIIKAFISFGEMTAESGFAKGGSAGDSLKSIYEGGSPEFIT